ncbi:MAG: TolC family protein [Ignavibacteriae bacterium]|nr:TolC family protein [Ignavibacteriota bacterium]
MKKLKILIIGLVLFSSGIINAQDSNTVRVYTLDDAIYTAKSNNTSLVNARFDRLKAEKKVSEVYSESLVPTMTLTSQYNRAFKKQVFDIFGQRFSIGTDNSFVNSLQVSEPIPVLGTPVFQAIRIADYYTGLQNENVNSAEAKVTADVKKAYYNVLFLKEVVNVRKLNLNNAVENYDVVERRYRNGTSTEFDYLRAKVTMENLKPPVVESENNLTITKKVLKNAIGLKDSKDVDVTGSLTFDSTEYYGSIDAVITKIAENNVSVRQLRINQDINKQLLSIDKANYLPKLYLFGQYNLQAAEDDGRSFGNYRYFNVINAGVGLNWDLNFFRNSYKVKQSEIEIKKTDETISDVKQKLRLLAQSIILKMGEAKNKVVATYGTVKMAERGYELAALSFKNGVVNQIDVLDAGSQLSNSKLGYYQAIVEYLNAKAELEELLEKK